MVNVQWHTGAISYVDRCILDDDNIFIAFRDTADGGKGKFIILDKTGSVIAAETVFKNASTYYISCAKLTNGNVVIAYALVDSPYNGKFVIYDSDGNEIISETEFESGTTIYISVTGLDNGNFFVAYKDSGDASKGKFAIHNSSGTQVVAPTTFSTNWVKYVEIVLLDNTNVFIVYQDDTDNNYGKFQIWDEDGNMVKGATIFDTHNPTIIRDKPVTLSNTNVVISYSRYTNRDADFQIWDEDGTVVVGHTIYEDEAFTYNSYNSVTEVRGQILFAVGEQDDDFGYRYVYTLGGVLITDKTKFTGDYYSRQPHCSTLAAGDLVIVYNGLNGANGYLYTTPAADFITPPVDIITYKRLMAVGGCKVFYEDI